MREYLFRGKSLRNEWVYGGYVGICNGGKIAKLTVIHIIEKCDNELVKTETVGQFTGLTDKNGKKIFEGDIVVTRYPKGDICSIGDVQFAYGVYGAEWIVHKKNKTMVGCWGQRHNLRRFDDDIIENIEVIGNIHDNLELLGENK